jgi:medium-chain acyl-[acyl-carrier-protein] hydrolase
MPANPWILRPVPAEPGTARLFCFPYAGVGGSVYAPWARQLRSDVEVCPVQLPGRESRLGERPHVRLSELLAEMGPALEAELDVPYVLFGHSMGALIAFELARELRDQGRPGPALVVVSGRRAPHLAGRRSPFGHIPDAEFITEIRHRYDGVPDQVLREPDLMALLLPALRADISLIESYAFQEAPPLDCPIVAFRGDDDPETTDAEVAAWGQHTSAGFRQQRFPGNHFFVRNAGAGIVAALATIVASAVAPRIERRL